MYSEQSKYIIPHRLFIYNLLIFNILLPVTSLLTHTEFSLLPISIICSLMVMLYIWYRANVAYEPRLVRAHWSAVWKRCKIVLIAYSITTTIELVMGLMAMMQPDPKMQEIMMIAFTRVAIVPTLLVVTPLLIASTLTVRKIHRLTPSENQAATTA